MRKGKRDGEEEEGKGERETERQREREREIERESKHVLTGLLTHVQCSYSKSNPIYSVI